MAFPRFQNGDGAANQLVNLYSYNHSSSGDSGGAGGGLQSNGGLPTASGMSSGVGGHVENSTMSAPAALLNSVASASFSSPPHQRKQQKARALPYFF